VNLLDKNRGFWAAAMLRCRAAHLLPATSVAVASLLASSSSFAQGSAVLTGTVTDAQTKRPLADVVVTVTSPALQGEQTVVTDASGSYRVPNLPPGDYNLRLDADAFRPYARGGITINARSTLRVNAELLPENVQLKAEEIVVIGKAPTVDVGSASSVVTINQDFANHLPLNAGNANRSFENLAVVAPGAQTDFYGVSINGTTSPENAFVIDGVSVNNPALGTNGTPLSTEFVKELNVISAGYMPEYGRSMGGIFDVVTQSGGNEFHGSVYFNITPGSLEGPRSDIRRDGTVISTNPSLGSLRDFGATVGGPIIKDKLWFFAGVQAAFTRYNINRRLSELVLDASGTPVQVDENGKDVTDPKYTGVTFTKVNPIKGGDKNYYQDDHTIQYLGKLTYLFNQDHNVTVSVSGTPTISGGNGTLANTIPANLIGPYSAYAYQNIETASDVSLKYSGAFNNKHQLLDVTFGWHHQRSATLPSDGSALGSKDGLAGIANVIYRKSSPANHAITDFESVPAGYCVSKTIKGAGGKDVKTNPCPVTSYTLGGPGFIDDASIDSYQAKVVGTSLFTAAGHHVVKAGLDGALMTYDHAKTYTGGNVFRESGSGSNFNDYRQYGFLESPDSLVLQNTATAHTNSTIVGAFVQDSWQILDKVTLNAGLRYDQQVMYGGDGKVGLSLPNQWSPRVGVIYDFTQQGRSKLYAYYARFYESVPLDIADRAFPGEVQAGARHSAKTCNPAVDPDSAACRTTPIANNPAFGNGTSNPNQKYQRTGGDKVPLDPNVAAQSSDQIVVGGEYEIIPDARVGITYTHSYLNRAIEDMSRDEANTYFIGNPGYGIASDFPKAERNYDAGTIFFQKAFANTWLAQVSYTLSSLRGNYSGLFRPESNQLDPNINSDFDLRSLLANRIGALPADRTHSIKILASKDFILPADQQITVGASFNTASGAPLNYLGSHPVYGSGEAFILPRGDGGRGDWIHRFDARVGYGVRLGKQSLLTFNVDIFNLFNFQGATKRDQNYTTTDVLPIADGKKADLETKLKHPDGTAFDTKTDVNPNFLNPTEYQDPRQFRFGAKVTF
jgi:Carboxypeptidase regulatory-like domain/TonB dependent receptor